MALFFSRTNLLLKTLLKIALSILEFIKNNNNNHYFHMFYEDIPQGIFVALCSKFFQYHIYFHFLQLSTSLNTKKCIGK